MKIVSSKAIDIVDYEGLVLSVTDWLEDLKLSGVDKLPGCYVTITVKSPGVDRLTKFTAKAELKDLVVDAALEGKDAWRRKGYSFLFALGTHTWKGETIHLTAGEALYLFKWLVLEDKEYYRTRWYYLRNMRRRLGNEFLADIEMASVMRAGK
jgi:hypothetical protein